ncbi:sensor histidine kinase [Isoptericola sp. 178]|uniref:sensor histidine kinase n=1 Tax=Isoptericola sp. 178 TaxID=3064651 RepID=UPI0027123A16|nr:sensor histidine kinase [Isoptericola sp. 178]MDO8143629.1 sensor histidine kinase [Isoptericola sp. 178]
MPPSPTSYPGVAPHPYQQHGPYAVAPYPTTVAAPWQPGRRRRPWSTWGSIGAVTVTWFCAVTGAAMDSPAVATTTQSALFLLWIVVASGVAAAVWWRATYPVAVCLATAAVGIVSPLGAVAPLLALPWVVARTDLRRSLICTGATALALVSAFWRDGSREGENVIFSTAPDPGGAVAYMTPLGYVILGVLALGLAVGVGMLRRVATRADADADAARSAATAESRRADTLEQQSESLRTELSRQEERDLIAREMHDTVAHQLSLMSLQASALEVSSGDAQTGDAARSMRSSAHRALEEMRTLITSLREGAEDYAGRDWTLNDLADLLDGAGSRGVDLVATVFVSDGDAAPPTLTRSVYRVVQESLTNAAKHAPGTRVAVNVRARPGDGVDVTVRNPATAGDTQVPGGGSGLRGMRERCEALGGTFDAGRQDDGSFLVRAHLPWSPATAH